MFHDFIYKLHSICTIFILLRGIICKKCEINYKETVDNCGGIPRTKNATRCGGRLIFSSTVLLTVGCPVLCGRWGGCLVTGLARRRRGSGHGGRWRRRGRRRTQRCVGSRWYGRADGNLAGWLAGWLAGRLWFCRAACLSFWLAADVQAAARLVSCCRTPSGARSTVRWAAGSRAAAPTARCDR